MEPETITLSVPPIYVNHTASGLNNGSSWQNASKELGEAIKNAPEWGVKIWVAKENYKPTYNKFYTTPP